MRQLKPPGYRVKVRESDAHYHGCRNQAYRITSWARRKALAKSLAAWWPPGGGNWRMIT